MAECNACDSAECGPETWADGKKCCPDCTHGVMDLNDYCYCPDCGRVKGPGPFIAIDNGPPRECRGCCALDKHESWPMHVVDFAVMGLARLCARAPYSVRWGWCGENERRFVTFGGAKEFAASLGLDADWIVANVDLCDGECDGLTEDERDALEEIR